MYIAHLVYKVFSLGSPKDREDPWWSPWRHRSERLIVTQTSSNKECPWWFPLKVETETAYNSMQQVPANIGQHFPKCGSIQRRFPTPFRNPIFHNIFVLNLSPALTQCGIIQPRVPPFFRNCLSSITLYHAALTAHSSGILKGHSFSHLWGSFWLHGPTKWKSRHSSGLDHSIQKLSQQI